MDLVTQIGSFVIVGVAISALIQIIRQKAGVGSNVAKLLTVALCLIVGAIVYWLAHSAYLQTVLYILGAASTAYGLFIKDTIPSTPQG